MLLLGVLLLLREKLVSLKPTLKTATRRTDPPSSSSPFPSAAANDAAAADDAAATDAAGESTPFPLPLSERVEPDSPLSSPQPTLLPPMPLLTLLLRPLPPLPRETTTTTTEEEDGEEEGTDLEEDEEDEVDVERSSLRRRGSRSSIRFHRISFSLFVSR